MSGDIVKWRCVFNTCMRKNPDWVNWAYKDKIVDEIKNGLICKMCGFGALVNETATVSKGWLDGVCELPEMTNRIPGGTPASGWVDGGAEGPKGPNSTYTVKEYKKKYQVDPELFYYFSHPNTKRPAYLIPQPAPSDHIPSPPPVYPQDLKWANKQIDEALKRAEELKKNSRLGAKEYIDMIGHLEELRNRRNAGVITDDMLKKDLINMWRINGIDK